MYLQVVVVQVHSPHTYIVVLKSVNLQRARVVYEEKQKSH